MGSWFEIHRSNVERLKSYVYPDGTISLYSHTPSFCEKVPFSNICDYFRKPVYRRTVHV